MLREPSFTVESNPSEALLCLGSVVSCWKIKYRSQDFKGTNDNDDNSNLVIRFDFNLVKQ